MIPLQHLIRAVSLRRAGKLTVEQEEGARITDEQRMDRLERISKLMSKAGLCARRHSREQDGKINILIDSRIKNEERFAALAPAQAALAPTRAGLA